MAAMTLVFFTACDDMDHAIADQTDRIDQLEKLSIKEIEDQITAINASIEDLEAVDKELDGYIQTLEVTAGNLQKELEDVNTAIDNLKCELEGEISTAKQELLDKLTDLQKDIENELAGIRKDIEELEAKDKELEGKIEDLQTYVDEKLGDTEDWAKATFATLEQYEALQEEVAEISESIAAINKSITDLETRVNDKIAADIKTATDALRTELGKDYTEKIDAAVKKVTEGYTTAVSAAKEEITAAYTKAIADAITASEKGMKEWVNKTLAEGYYDIAAIDAKLKELETSLTGADTELAEQIEAQKEALEQAKEDLKKAYEKAIADAIETNNGVITEAYEEAIDEAVEDLNATISGINAAIDDIKVKLGIIDKEITALKTRIQSIRFMPEYSDGKVELDGSVTLKFILAPKAAAGEIKEEHVSSFISRTKERTKAAGGPAALTVESVTGDESTGMLEVVVNGASLAADFWADGNNANTYICISDGNNDIISEMIPTFTRPYVTFNAETEQTMKLSEGVAVKSSGASEGFEYSVGWGEWTTLNTGEPVTFGGTHGALRLRGKSETGTEGKKIEFGNNTEVAASGDIRTLIDWTGHDTAETGNAVFAGLFQGCTQLTSAPELPSTELAEGCYENMFAGCTSLTEAPVLPAPVLTENCYQGMFSGCTSLESVTMLATDVSASGCLENWLNDVAEDGKVNLAPGVNSSEIAKPEDWISGKDVIGEEEFIAAVSNSNDGTIMLTGDINLSQPATIPTGSNITIDLNGYSISQKKNQTAAYSMIQNNGTLVIKDSKGNGKIVYGDTGNGGEYVSNTIWNNGNLRIVNGIFENNSSDIVADNGYPHVIDNYAILNIDGGTFTNHADYSSIRIWCTTDDDTAVIINDGTFNGCIDLHNVNTNANKGTLTINDGTFNADTYTKCAIRLLGFGLDVDELHCNISGGTFNGNIKLNNYTGSGLFNSDVFHITGGTFTSFTPLDYMGEGEKATFKLEDGRTITIDDIDATTRYITNLENMKSILTSAGAAGAGDTTIHLMTDIDMTGSTWTPIKVDGYHGADIVTIEGHGSTITGLTAGLFAGGFAGGSGIVIKDLTISRSKIEADNTQGYGAFVGCADSMDEITLINCHLLDSDIITPDDGSAESRIGGLVGWTAGYNNQNDGPVDSYITIKDCSVIGCTLKGAGSIGGIVGHAGANAATFTTIENCTVKDNLFISTDDGNWRVGVVVGTANNGQAKISNITESGNTLEQTGKTAPTGDAKRHYYGRFVPAGTGTLVIDDVNIKE